MRLLSKHDIARSLAAHDPLMYDVWLIVHGGHRPFTEEEIRDRFRSDCVPAKVDLEWALEKLRQAGLLKKLLGGGWV